jgi:hypothetical protein
MNSQNPASGIDYCGVSIASLETDWRLITQGDARHIGLGWAEKVELWGNESEED